MKARSDLFIYAITFIIIMGYMIFDFKMKGYREFPQLNYDWEEEIIVKDFGVQHITQIDHNLLSLKKKLNSYNFSNDNTIKIVTRENNSYFYRYQYKVENDGVVSFRGGIWLTQIPSRELHSSNTHLYEVSIPIDYRGEVSLCFIGYSDDKWGAFRSLRKDIIAKNDHFNLVGRDQDIYGYNYINFNFNLNQQSQLKLIRSIPIAECYILFFDTVDIFNSLDVIDQIIENIPSGNASVYINTFPLTNDKSIDTKISIYNDYLKRISQKINNLNIIDLEEGFEDDKASGVLNYSSYNNYLNLISKELSVYE